MEYSKEKKLGIFAIIIIAIMGLHFYLLEQRTLLKKRIDALEIKYSEALMLIEDTSTRIIDAFFIETTMEDYPEASAQLQNIKRSNSMMINRRKKSIYKRYGF